DVLAQLIHLDAVALQVLDNIGQRCRKEISVRPLHEQSRFVAAKVFKTIFLWLAGGMPAAILDVLHKAQEIDRAAQRCGLLAESNAVGWLRLVACAYGGLACLREDFANLIVVVCRILEDAADKIA